MTATDTPPNDVRAAARAPGPSPEYGHLPLRDWDLVHCPAIPYKATPDGKPDANFAGDEMIRLGVRGSGPTIRQAYNGLATEYTIANQTRSAEEFAFNHPEASPFNPSFAANPLLYTGPENELALDTPEQFRLTWTTYDGVLAGAQDLVGPFADTLKSTTAAAATASFWPTIANFGLPYNLLILKKVDRRRCAALASDFGDAWAAENLDPVQAAGLLYEIDMTIMGSLPPFTRVHPISGWREVRFTPGTVTVLKQDPQSKALTPVLIEVSTTDGRRQAYRAGDKAWLYALQAAKTSITVYGIWLGHVYHWHTVTGALQMTMYNELPAGHRLWPVLEPQSRSLIAFNFALLMTLWDRIAPPTPVDGALSLLRLLDRFSENREFFDDDPRTELQQQGLQEADFTVHKPWDAYPVVGFLLNIWDLTQAYVAAVVKPLYPTDQAVADDPGLKAWMDASRDPLRGNVRGLPEVDTCADLIAVLTSYLYRVNAHGAASLTPSVNPVLSFVANFPPCLQGAAIPGPSDDVSTQQLLNLLPHTGTLGGMTTFYYTFAYTPPDHPLIPPPPYQPGNDPLGQFQAGIQGFIGSYVNGLESALQQYWGHKPTKPTDPKSLYQQWAMSIEI